MTNKTHTIKITEIKTGKEYDFPPITFSQAAEIVILLTDDATKEAKAFLARETGDDKTE